MSASVALPESALSLPGADHDFHDEFETLLCDFLRREKSVDIWCGAELALRTLTLLQTLVSSQSAWRDEHQLLYRLQATARRVVAALPDLPSAHVSLLRVLKLVREQRNAAPGGGLSAQARPAAAPAAAAAPLRDDLLAALDEVRSEMENATDSMVHEAAAHIGAGDVIMTTGDSPLVSSLLIDAARAKKSFQVLVVDCAPFSRGTSLAGRLAASAPRLTVTRVALSAVFALMPRVTKVLLGAHTVLADGGLWALSGACPLALAARHHAVPVIVCAPSYQLSPRFQRSGRRDASAHLVSPEAVLPYAAETTVARSAAPAPLFDYVSPALVTLFVTQTGGVSPWYIHRLINDYYDSNDYSLFQT